MHPPHPISSHSHKKVEDSFFNKFPRSIAFGEKFYFYDTVINTRMWKIRVEHAIGTSYRWITLHTSYSLLWHHLAKVYSIQIIIFITFGNVVRYRFGRCCYCRRCRNWIEDSHKILLAEFKMDIHWSSFHVLHWRPLCLLMLCYRVGVRVRACVRECVCNFIFLSILHEYQLLSISPFFLFLFISDTPKNT